MLFASTWLPANPAETSLPLQGDGGQIPASATPRHRSFLQGPGPAQPWPPGSCSATLAEAGALEKPQTASLVRARSATPPGTPTTPAAPGPLPVPLFQRQNIFLMLQTIGKQDVTAAGVDSAGAWEGSRNNKGGFSEQQPPLSGCSRGSGPAGALAGCPHGMSAQARALSPSMEGGGKTGQGE